MEMEVEVNEIQLCYDLRYTNFAGVIDFLIELFSSIICDFDSNSVYSMDIELNLLSSVDGQDQWVNISCENSVMYKGYSTKDWYELLKILEKSYYSNLHKLRHNSYKKRKNIE